DPATLRSCHLAFLTVTDTAQHQQLWASISSTPDKRSRELHGTHPRHPLLPGQQMSILKHELGNSLQLISSEANKNLALVS
ncbi:mCG114159, partial [Mus musculus]